MKITSGIFLSLGLLIHTTTISAQDQDADFPCCECPIVPAYPLDPCCINAGYPLPATISPCGGWNLYAKGDFLYWSVGLDIIQNFAQKLTLDRRDTKNFFHNAPYRPGFRVALGVDLGSAVLDFTYIRSHHRTHHHVSAGPNEMTQLVFAAPSIAFGPPTLPQLVFSNIRSSLQLDVDWGVLSLQKPVYFGEKIIINLNYGLAMVWTGEKWDYRCTALGAPPPLGAATTTGFVSTNHRSWSIGPNLGCNAIALLPMGFKAIANVHLSIQYSSEYKGITTTSFPAIPFTTFNTNLKSKGSIPHFQATHGGELGLGWGGYFCCERIYLEFFATYAIHYQHVELVGFPVSETAVDLLGLVGYNMHGISIGGSINF